MSRPSVLQRRFLHLWFVNLATDRVRLMSQPASDREAARPPFGLVVKIKGALRLQAVDEAAHTLGLRPKMSLADARALAPDLRVQDADLAADVDFLQQLMQAHRRYTPALALAPPDGIDLDVTGSAALFGSETALVEDLTARLRRAGVTAQVGVFRLGPSPAGRMYRSPWRAGGGGGVERGGPEAQP